MARSNLVRALLLGALVLLLVPPALAGSPAIGRALMINPKLLILDEATEGLAPLVRAEIWRVLETLKRDGQAILLIDKNVAALLRVADRHVIIEKGRAVWTGTSAELSADRPARERFLGV